MNLFKRYETDPGKESKGVPIKVDECTFFCRRAGGVNRAYRAAMALHSFDPDVMALVASKDVEKQLAGEDLATMRSFADAVITGWENVFDRDDQPWEFTKENFIDLVTSCPDVWVLLRVEARDQENFRLERVKKLGDDLGNSSSGTSSGTAQPSND